MTKRRNGYFSRPLSFYVLVILSIFSSSLVSWVQVTAGSDSKSLVFESFSRFPQKLSLCFSTRQPIPTVSWITCEWAVDFMTPTWLKRLCVVLVALLNLSFLALAVVAIFSYKNLMVKIHEHSSTKAFESFAGSMSSFLLARQ